MAVIDMTQKYKNLYERIIARDTTITELTTSAATIGNSALRNFSSLTHVYLKGATAIKAQAMQGCANLRDIYIYTNSVCALENMNAIPTTQTIQTTKIHVPAALIRGYETAANWATLYGDGDIEFISL